RLGEMLVEMRHAPDPRLLLEVALVQLTHDAAGSDVHTLMARLERLEQAVAEGAAAAEKTVPTNPTTGKATIGGRARRDAAQHPAAARPHLESTVLDSTPTAPDAPAAASTGVDDHEVPALFERQVRPALRGMAKAIYMGAHVGPMSNGALVVNFAGEPHRVRAEEYRQEVERALAAAAGRTIRLSLGVDHAAGNDDNVVQLKRAQQAPADEDVDTADLVDVPPEAVVSPIDRLTQAFPGSEIIEEHT
ncbi:MAG TPA: hypothetical protein VLD86_00220, partial [Ilumatobacteraceae bacterium]|nr:hypothetical protein [Ilumatobacteraceae bacterium]